MQSSMSSTSSKVSCFHRMWHFGLLCSRVLHFQRRSLFQNLLKFCAGQGVPLKPQAAQLRHLLRERERDEESLGIAFLTASVANEACFFLLFTGYIFSSCLRVAYALPTPLRCFPTRGLFVLICLRVPTLTSCFLILPTRLAVLLLRAFCWS